MTKCALGSLFICSAPNGLLVHPVARNSLTEALAIASNEF